MFQEYFRQRNASIQKTIETKVNQCLTLYSFISSRDGWRKYFTFDTVINSISTPSWYDNVKRSCDLYNNLKPDEQKICENDFIDSVTRIVNNKSKLAQPEVISFSNRYEEIYIKLTTDHINISFYPNREKVGTIIKLNIDTDITEEQFFEMINKGITDLRVARFKNQLKSNEKYI